MIDVWFLLHAMQESTKTSFQISMNISENTLDYETARGHFDYFFLGKDHFNWALDDEPYSLGPV